jgi:hypothetical protein
MEQSSPGWKMYVDKDWLHTNQLRGTICFSYIVDTSNSWTMLGGMSANNVRQAAATYEKFPVAERQDFLDNANAILAKASDAHAQAGSELAVSACEVAMICMCGTKTYRLVQQDDPELKGHWFTVLYRLNNGAILRRPTHIRTRDAANQPVGLGDLVDIIRNVVAHDTRPGTGVYAQIQEGGGAHIREEWL